MNLYLCRIVKLYYIVLCIICKEYFKRHLSGDRQLYTTTLTVEVSPTHKYSITSQNDFKITAHIPRPVMIF